MVLEKDEDDQLHRWSQGRKEYFTYSKRRKAAWLGHVLHRNCHLKHAMEGKVEGGMEVTGRKRRRRKQLL